MKLFALFKNTWRYLRTELSALVHLTRLQHRYPTCRFYSGAFVDDLSQLGKYNVLFLNVKVNKSTIGDHTFIQKNTIVNNARIGRFCSIAGGVTVGLGQHPLGQVSSHPAFYSATQPIVKTFSDEDLFVPLQKTEIGHDVWIGQNAMITDGIRIGTGAVIAAGAVVTRDVPEYAVVAGVPAKLIKFRFDENLRKKLIATKWWDMPEQWMQKNISIFADPLKFVNDFENSQQ